MREIATQTDEKLLKWTLEWIQRGHKRQPTLPPNGRIYSWPKSIAQIIDHYHRRQLQEKKMNGRCAGGRTVHEDTVQVSKYASIRLTLKPICFHGVSQLFVRLHLSLVCSSNCLPYSNEYESHTVRTIYICTLKFSRLEPLSIFFRTVFNANSFHTTQEFMSTVLSAMLCVVT